MSNNEAALAQATSQLTREDIMWVRERAGLAVPGSYDGASSQEEETQEEDSRRQVDHEWPDVGATLEAEYQGEHYEAEVIAMPRYKSGKALRLLTGPAAGEEERSMSGAMLTATEQLREERDLGRKGVSNGWHFWNIKQGGGDDESQ